MRSVAAVFVLLQVVACAGSAPERTRYLLRDDVQERTGRVEAPTRVALGRVSVAPYLDQAGIVVETEPGQVHAARQHEWAEPLEAGLRSTLRDGLADALGHDVSSSGGTLPWDYRVDVHVDRLHGTMDGTAVLDASYRISPRPGSGETVAYRFVRSSSLPRAGYPGLVDAEAGLVRELARAIAASLRESGEADGPAGAPR